MNIFITDPDPRVCAKNLDDKRVIKMILESCQMLSTAMNLSGRVGPYKTTHANHPCSIWARTSRENYMWLLQHMQFLCMEYKHTYEKTHKCANYLHDLFNGRWAIPDGLLTPFANCTPYKNMDTIEAYKLTMNRKWLEDKRSPTWKKRSKPIW